MKKNIGYIIKVKDNFTPILKRTNSLIDSLMLKINKLEKENKQLKEIKTGCWDE